MRRQQARGRTFPLVMLMACAPATVSAQDRVPAATGSSQSQAFQPQGLSAGGFRLYPELRLSTGYDDNIVQSDERRRGDGSFVVAPTITGKSQWSSHRLDAEAFYRDTRYFKRGEQNHDEYGAGFDGRLDVLRTTNVTTSANYGRLAEQRGTPGDLFLSNQLVRYNSFSTRTQAYHQINRIGLGFGIGASSFRYDNIGTAGDNLAQNFRDRSTASANARIEYQLSAVTSLFVTGAYNSIDYRRRTLLDRSSTGANLLGGVRFELTQFLRGTIGLGYIRQAFANPVFADFNGLNYNASLSYQPTTLTSLSLTAGRRLTDSAIFDVAGVLTQDVRLSVDHELLRSLNLQGHLTYSNFEYRGIERSDNRFEFGAGARYKMSRTVSVALSGSRVTQDSGDLLGRGYRSNRATLSLLLSR